MTFDAHAFLKGLKRQLELCDQLAGVEEAQKKAFDSGEPDMTRLLKVVEQKQELMQEWSALDRELADAREAWPGERDRIDSALATEIEKAAGETRDRLKAILSMEEEQRALLDKLRGGMADRIREAQQRKRVLNAYGKKPGQGGSRFYDKNQ